MNFRIRLISLAIFIAFVSVIVRLFYWQVIKSHELTAQARRQYQSGNVITAPRGDIYSSDKSMLAARVDGWLLYAEIPNIEEKGEKIAEKLAGILIEKEEDDYDSLLHNEVFRINSLLGKKGAVWVKLEEKLDGMKKREIEKLDIKGLGFETQELRIYPEASTAAHLLGFVGRGDEGEDKGYFGLEGYYDLTLKGKSGYTSGEFDAKGDPILTEDIREVDAIDGVGLVTNIDKYVQLSVESKLEKGIEKYGAVEGSVIVMDPKTGSVLAMASFPSFDPEKYYDYSDELFRNPTISDVFEPGSVFKVVVMASALDAGAVRPDTKCDICSGPLKIDKYSIETWDNNYFPDSTMQDVIIHSDNVGMVFVGQKMGSDTLWEYLDKFGFGKKTGIDLQGEVSSQLRAKEKWSVVDLATATFGQGIAITPIQMARAVSAIANKGMMPVPRVVGALVNGTWEQEIKLEPAIRVVSEKAAEEITLMMVEAAKKGESKWTYVGGFGVAGKTGTAQIPISGHYDKDKTIASFVGFAPFDNPKFVMLVTLKEPQSSQWASETAAPLWYDIADDLFRYYNIQPKN